MNKLISVLVWVLPISFCLHVAEEFLLPGGFIKWYHTYRPKFSMVRPSHYFKVNAIGFMLILATAIVTSKTGGGYGGILIIYGFLSWNAITTHVLGAIKTKQYSPGMITGVVFYLPLTVISYITVIELKSLDILSLIFCIVISPLLEIFFSKKPGPGSGNN